MPKKQVKNVEKSTKRQYKYERKICQDMKIFVRNSWPGKDVKPASNFTRNCLKENPLFAGSKIFLVCFLGRSFRIKKEKLRGKRTESLCWLYKIVCLIRIVRAVWNHTIFNICVRFFSGEEKNKLAKETFQKIFL